LQDKYGDRLPRGALSRLGTVRWRHAGDITCMVFSPDNAKIATAGKDRAIRIWNAQTGLAVQTLRGHAEPVTRVVYSAKGKFLASSDENSNVIVWETNSGQKIAEMSATGSVLALVFSPDERRLLVSRNDASFQVWDTVAMKEYEGRLSRSGKVSCLRFSKDGTSLAGGDSNGIFSLWDARDFKRVSSVDGKSGPVVEIMADEKNDAFLCVTKSLSKSDSLEIKTWDIPSGTLSSGPVIQKPEGSVSSLVFSPNASKIALGTEYGFVRVVDSKNGKSCCDFRTEFAIKCLSFSANGMSLAAGAGNSIRAWNLADKKEINHAVGHANALTCIRFLDEKVLITCGDDNTIRLWDLENGSQLNAFDKGVNNGPIFEISPDGTSLISAFLGIKLFKITKNPRDLLPGGGGPQELRKNLIRAVNYSRESKFYALGDSKGIIQICDSEKQRKIWELAGKPRNSRGEIVAIGFSPDSKSLGSVDFRDQRIDVWNLHSGQRVREFVEKGLMAAAFSPTWNFVGVALRDHTIVLLDIGTGQVTRSWPSRQEWITCLSFSSDGRTLVSGAEDGSICLWETLTGGQRIRMAGHRGPITSLDISKDGMLLASGSDDTTGLVWDVTSLSKAWDDNSEKNQSSDLDTIYDRLGSSSSATANLAMWQLISNKLESVAYLSKRIRIPIRPSRETVLKLLGDLNSNEFLVRENATAELSKLGDLVKKELQEALDEKPSSEAARRIKGLISDLSSSTNTNLLRETRVIEVLERVGNIDTQKLLAKISNGAPEAQLTIEAKNALQRIQRSNRNHKAEKE
jgi:WD40 repeat protein